MGTHTKELMALSQDIYSQLDLDVLSRKQRLFVLLFDGRRPSEVAADAGYSFPDQAASRLMSNPDVQKNIEIISKALEKSIIASKLDVLKFWSDVMFGDDPNFNPADRMKASENLGKVHRLIGPDLVRAEVRNNNINIIVQSHEPQGQEELAEFNRLQLALEDQTNAELSLMTGKP